MTKKLSLTNTSVADLMKTLAEKREELRAHRFSAVGGRPKDTNGPKKVRKEIARLLTEVGSRTA